MEVDSRVFDNAFEEALIYLYGCYAKYLTGLGMKIVEEPAVANPSRSSSSSLESRTQVKAKPKNFLMKMFSKEPKVKKHPLAYAPIELNYSRECFMQVLLSGEHYFYFSNHVDVCSHNLRRHTVQRTFFSTKHSLNWKCVSTTPFPNGLIGFSPATRKSQARQAHKRLSLSSLLLYPSRTYSTLYSFHRTAFMKSISIIVSGNRLKKTWRRGMARRFRLVFLTLLLTRSCSCCTRITSRHLCRHTRRMALSMNMVV
jgi:hypothetical protein